MENKQTQMQHTLAVIHQTVSTILGFQKGRKNDLSPIALAILYNAHTKQLQITDIAQTFDIKKSTASGYIDNLEKKGYAKRVKDNSNRRNTYVTVTEKGEKLLSSKEKELEEYVNQHLGNLTPEEQIRFVELLEKFQKTK